jgi:hypothetical protein
MMKIKLFEEFKKSGETDNYPPPKYLVEPHKGEKGFFMFKRAFDKKKKRFDTGYFSTTVNWEDKQ